MTYVDPEDIRSQLQVHLGGKATGAPAGGWLKPYAWRHPSEIPHREWLYGGHYIRDFVTATFAPGAAGKSNLEIAEAICMATGRPLLGVHPEGRFRVGYWNGEDPLEEIERRVAAVMKYFAVKPEDVEGWFFWGSGRENGLVVAEQTPDGTVINAPVVDQVKAMMGDLKLDAFQIDPFVSSHRVTENDNNAIDMVVKAWGRISGETHSCIELVHHTTKAAIGREVQVQDGRGGGALLFGARSARVLNTMTEEEADLVGIKRFARRRYFRVDNGKANLRPPPDKSEWYKTESIDLDNGPGGAAGDSIGVVTQWEWPADVDRQAPSAKPLKMAGQKIMAAFHRLLDQGRGTSAPSVPGVPPGTLAVVDGELRKMAIDIGLFPDPHPGKDDKAALTTWQNGARQAWLRGTKEIQEAGLLRFEVGFWWAQKPVTIGFRPAGDDPA